MNETDKITIREALMVLALASGNVDETNIVQTMRDLIKKVEDHTEGVTEADMDVRLSYRLVDWMIAEIFGN